MFSTGDEVVHKTALFGGVIFDTHRISGGGLSVDMGVGEPLGLLIIFLFFAVLATFFQLALIALKNYRAQLIEERSHQ